MAEAYCVKDKKKVEVQNAAEDHDEERQAGAPGHVPAVRRQGLPDRRLTDSFDDATVAGPPPIGGGLPCPASCPGRMARMRPGRRTRGAARRPFGRIAATLDPRWTRGPCRGTPRPIRHVRC